MNSTQLTRCSLCSRDFFQRDLRHSQNGVLCHSCWSVICPQPWPKDDSAHGGVAGVGQGGSRPDGLAAMSAKAAAQEAADAAHAAQAAHRLTAQRRSYSMANIANMSGVAVPGRRPASRLPNSMPEHPGLLCGSADDPRWGVLPQAGSAPIGRNHSLGTAPEAPTFSPVELRNMMHEESLELFESQSHLLDYESRVALQRQRLYLQLQNSVDEPGPMQSDLERQDSAGSGCNEDILRGAAGAANGMLLNGVPNGSGDTSSQGTGGSMQLLHELQEARRHLAAVSREREALSMRVHQLEAELQSQKESVLCKICHQATRNCVVLPCLHFTSCDTCFKRHCASALSCPMCNGRVTGFQTLLML